MILHQLCIPSHLNSLSSFLFTVVTLSLLLCLSSGNFSSSAAGVNSRSHPGCRMKFINTIYVSLQIQVLIFWLLTLCSGVIDTKISEDLDASVFGLKNTESGGSNVLRNTINLAYYYTVSEPRSTRPESSWL